MKKRTLAAVVAVSLLCAGGVAAARNPPVQTTRTTTTATTAMQSGALDEGAIKAHIADAGYKEVKGLKFKDGVWQAKARGGNDKWVHVKIGPTTGKVYEADAPSRLNKNEIKATLTAQGYQNVHDVKFNDGLWEAVATNPQGTKMDLLADPDDGSVVASKKD